ncbi:ribonuclease T2 family protein [Sphingobium algorifonticola]|uniref:Ribonuclease T n=1 Tax=Sphingobium algorifonticola TaxID=2008318 RepID=A0A437J683_9SPHN|nr:ribonuclease T [Sphingobium algorifonticola]RVT40682.1 ribonuclease T [Sphingobium algorifonticola]
MFRLLLGVTLTFAPAAALAQVEQCTPPRTVPRPRPDLPSASQPKRVLPIGGYTLAITWSPQYCAGKTGARDAFQCANRTARFGFTLHGLWPDGVGKDWPQYCRATGILSRATIRQNMCVTPSAQLIQHEWAKHGTCMTANGQPNGQPIRPDAYFGKSRALYQALRFPDMAALARRESVTAGQIARAVADANPGIRPDMMRVTATRDGWLDELWLCLDRRFRYAKCPAHQGGVNEGAKVRVRG